MYCYTIRLPVADKEYDGTLWVKDGLRVKYLPQEPDLDMSLDVMGNIRRGIAEQVGVCMCVSLVKKKSILKIIPCRCIRLASRDLWGAGMGDR